MKEKPELVNMVGMNAFFYFKDGTILKVSGKKGIYNNKTNDMSFREEVKVVQAENQIFADNLDYFNLKKINKYIWQCKRQKFRWKFFFRYLKLKY